jgi:CDP-diacylglycerol--serine O-phosphatidyltransferase
MYCVNDVKFALVCLVIAGICDMFDGKIARMCKRTEQEKEFGIQLDSLCDVISFVVFPSIFLMEYGDILVFTTDKMSEDIAIMLIAGFYLVAGIERLGWFNITTDGATKYFSGLPVTTIAIILPLIYLIFGNSVYFGLSVLVAEFITGVLFISNFKLKKPNVTWSIGLVIVALAIIVLNYIIK